MRHVTKGMWGCKSHLVLVLTVDLEQLHKNQTWVQYILTLSRFLRALITETDCGSLPMSAAASARVFPSKSPLTRQHDF